MSDRAAMRAFLWSGAALMASLGFALMRSNWVSVDEIRQLSAERAAVQELQAGVWREKLDLSAARIETLERRVDMLEAWEDARKQREGRP